VPGPVYQFGDFQLDCGAFKLLRNEQSLRVERKPLELLILLASRPGQLVTRTEIAQRLWSSEVFVDTEHGINTAIRKLRHLLHDDPENPQFIQTVTGMGYRFVATVSVTSEIPAINPEPASALTGNEKETPHPVPNAASPSKGRTLSWYAGAGVCALLAFGGTALYRSQYHSPQVTYTQLTDFTDSAVQPALLPDGRMMAFIRGGSAFMTADQIWIKMMPNGEARRLTQDDRPKYGLAFSPDGSEIAYTVMEGPVFSTYEISTLGGDSQLLQKNAAGLVWLDPQRLLYSEAPSGIHLGVVTSTLARTDLRAIYFPPHERGMVHYSFPSPDRRWALLVEMNGLGKWAPCRLVALEGQPSTRTVGPNGGCTSAGWSPDGRWMYFTASVQGQSHIWRQHFPEAEPEQITFGPTEEVGIAVDPDGRSLITSLGAQESAIWIHDPHGDRSLSSEGEVILDPSPVFSADGTTIYYLLKRPASGTEMWRTRTDTGTSEAVFPGTSMSYFDISPDGKQVVYTVSFPNQAGELWLAPIDRSSPPTKLAISGAQTPRFGGHGEILFEHAESSANYLERIDPDGTHRQKVLPNPVLDLQSISPGRRWVTIGLPKTPEANSPTVAVVPLDGGSPVRVCASFCIPKWSTDGKFFFVSVEDPTRTGPGRSLAIPAGSGESLPPFPLQGIPLGAGPSVIKGAVEVPRGDLVPGADVGHYAWVNTTAHRNLYRISLP
jgi:DNA-binding winged helix-turn-helix (wHTH) protein/Tol biopolymer transport system component